MKAVAPGIRSHKINPPKNPDAKMKVVQIPNETYPTANKKRVKARAVSIVYALLFPTSFMYDILNQAISFFVPK